MAPWIPYFEILVSHIGIKKQLCAVWRKRRRSFFPIMIYKPKLNFAFPVHHPNLGYIAKLWTVYREVLRLKPGNCELNVERNTTSIGRHDRVLDFQKLLIEHV